MSAFTLIKAICSTEEGNATAVIVEEVTFETKPEAKAAQEAWDAVGFPHTSTICPRSSDPKTDARKLEFFRADIRGDQFAR